MTPTLTGPIHPLNRLILDGDRARRQAAEAYLPVAKAIVGHHYKHGISDQSIYRIDGPGCDEWEYKGAHEDASALLGHGPQYVAITVGDKPWNIARRIAPDAAPREYERAVQLRDAARRATPMVGVALAVCLRAGALEWDTGETVADAAWRVSLDAAWQLLPALNPVLPAARDIFAAVLHNLGVVERPAVDYARDYLANREAIAIHVRDNDVEWGGELLDSAAAAQRAGLAPSTWRSHISRQQAPGPDLPSPPRWRPATIDAWRLTQPRAHLTGW